MKRRAFLEACGAGLAAGHVNGESILQPIPAGTQRVVFRAVGLNALLVNSDANDTKDISVDFAGLDSDGVELDGTSEKMHPHVPLLVIAADCLADKSMGTTPTDPERLAWRLRTPTTDFRYWPLTKKTWSIDKIVGPELALGVYGAVPLKRLNHSLTTLNWNKKNQASAQMTLEYGRITDDIPRLYKDGWERRRWVFTTDTFANEAKKSLPVHLTDTIRVELDAKASDPAIFNVKGLAPIVTKGNWVEAYLITLPHKLLKFEEDNPKTLHHVTAAYHLFDQMVTTQKVLPKTDRAPAGAEPVFCPPVMF
jgi:hypothetical protein